MEEDHHGTGTEPPIVAPSREVTVARMGAAAAAPGPDGETAVTDRMEDIAGLASRAGVGSPLWLIGLACYQ